MVWTYHASYFSFASRSTTGTTHRLGDVRVPTLVVVGDNDVGEAISHASSRARQTDSQQCSGATWATELEAENSCQ